MKWMRRLCKVTLRCRWKSWPLGSKTNDSDLRMQRNLPCRMNTVIQIQFVHVYDLHIIPTWKVTLQVVGRGGRGITVLRHSGISLAYSVPEVAGAFRIGALNSNRLAHRVYKNNEPRCQKVSRIEVDAVLNGNRDLIYCYPGADAVRHPASLTATNETSQIDQLLDEPSS
jgi:hypothetical protein